MHAALRQDHDFRGSQNEEASHLARPLGSADRHCRGRFSRHRTRRHQGLQIRARRSECSSRPRQGYCRTAHEHQDRQDRAERRYLCDPSRYGAGRHAGDGHQGRVGAGRRTRHLQVQGGLRNGGPVAAFARRQGSRRDRHGRKQACHYGAKVKRAVLASVAVAAVIAAAGGAFIGVRGHLHSAGESAAALVAPAAAQISDDPVYYQDPDGRPFYSLTPKKTADGRDYRAVPASADLSFDEAPAAAPATTVAADRKIKFYRNPMGLADISPTPKKDSMGMDYIPVYEDEDTDDGAVKLSPGKIQRTGVKSESAARRVIRTMIRVPGTIQLDERRVSVISMRAESYVQKVADVTTGAHVVKGQPLMEIYSPAVSSAAAEYISTLNSKVTGGDGPYGRGSRQRLMNLDVPEAAIVSIEKGRNVPIGIEWTSPRDGIVLERNVTEGMRAQPGNVLFRIADHSVVWAIVDVAERDLGSVAVGQRATVRARSFPGREFSGKINVIYPQINKETRTARVRVELPNPDLLLIHDMYVDAEIETGSAETVLAIPESAVLDSGSRQAVLVDRGEGRFEPREVKLGHRGEGYVEVREGLAEDDPVVTSANFLIDAESNLKAALKGFAEGAQP